MHYKIGITCPADSRIIEIIIRAALAAGADRIGNKAAFVFQGQEAELRAYSSTKKMEDIVWQASVYIEVRCTQEYLYEVYQAIKKVHPQQDPVIEVFRLEDLFTESHILLTLLGGHYALLKKVIETNAQTPDNEGHASQWDAHFLTQLPQLEWRLMRYLQQHPDRACTRTELQQAIWGKDHLSSPDALEQLVRRLRKRIELNPQRPEYLLTVRGLGYRLIGNPKPSREQRDHP